MPARCCTARVDVASWNSAGDLEYLGRADDQVKIRGFRIEIGEIESAVLADVSVAQTAVVVREDSPGDQRLVAYVVPAAGVSVSVDDVRTGVGSLLPEYMVPSAFVVLDSIPLTVNGKLDRRALPVPSLQVAVFRAPTSVVEEVVAQTFADVLGVERVGLDDDFFALGGNSLIATQVTSRLGQALDASVSVRELFEASTVEALAARLGSHVGGGSRAALTAQVRPVRVPLSLAQQRMWFLNQIRHRTLLSTMSLLPLTAHGCARRLGGPGAFGQFTTLSAATRFCARSTPRSTASATRRSLLRLEDVDDRSSAAERGHRFGPNPVSELYSFFVAAGLRCHCRGSVARQAFSGQGR